MKSHFQLSSFHLLCSRNEKVNKTKLSFLASILKKLKKSRNIKLLQPKQLPQNSATVIDLKTLAYVLSLCTEMSYPSGRLGQIVWPSQKTWTLKDSSLRIHEGFHPNLHAGVGALLVHCKSSNKGLCLRYRVFWLRVRRNVWKFGGASIIIQGLLYEKVLIWLVGWSSLSVY